MSKVKEDTAKVDNTAVDKFTGGWGEWLENKTGIPSEIGVYTNPGAWYGGHKAGKLSKKFVLGDEDLGWSPLINSKYFKRYSKIPIEEGGYYRVTSNNEIAAINKSGKLQVPDRSYYDTQTARLIADRLKMTPEEVLALDNKNPKLLDEMFNAAPKPKGTLGLRPRRKSNHGDVAFQKEGLFYDSNNPKSPYYGSPTIKGSQSKSRFQEGHHGKYTDNFNEDININEAPHYGASVLREGNEASNFTYFDRGLFGWREKTFDNNNGLINKNHWIFNREARTPTNIATANRITPFLSKVEKLPLKVVAYNAAKRTNGNASVSMQDIKNIKPISKNESKRSFSHGDRYEQLYPGIYNRRYEMRSVVPQGRPLKFSSSEYAGNNPVGKVIGKEGDMWKFNPADYAKRWNESPNAPDQVRLTKQAALMDKVGTPFILQQSNPIWIEGRSVRQAMKVGGKFTFKKSPAVKDAEKLNGKRDMRKKFVKSSRPTYKRRIRKGQVGMRFVSYVPVNNPTIDYTDITNPINPFSEYYIPTTYNTEQALVVPEREDSKSDTVEETPAVASKPIAEPVVNKPVASKVVVDTANSTWSSPYKDRSKWMADLTNAYKRAGITNDNAIRMLVSQDALESAWGRSAQGKFNFGNLTTGAKWQGDYVTGNDHDAAGNPIKQKFRSYNSMDEYAADKVQFLKRLYDFDENDDINKFVAKLTGSNKGKRRYAEATNYANTLKKVYNSYRSGGIIKYQEPANGIQRRDATYVSPTYHNSPYRDVNYKPTSEIEIVSPKWTMQDGRLIKTTSQIKNRVIPLETVSPEFDVLTGIRGMASLLGNKPKPMIFKSNTSKLAKAERMGIPKGESPSPYKQIGTVDEVSEHYMKATGDIFGPFMDKQSEHAVFNHATDPSKIVKVYAVNDKGFADIAAIKEFQAHYMKRNQIPFGVKNRFSGYLKGKDGIFPVYTQDKVTPLKAMNNTQYEKEIFPKLVEQLKAKGYTQTSPDVFSNGKFKITDLYPDNMGYDSQGNLIFFDAKTYRFGGLLGRRHRL